MALASFADPDDRPRRMTIVNRSEQRLAHLQAVHDKLDTDIAFQYLVHEDPRQNDAAMENLPPGSVVINATGMGKDLSGSPITAAGASRRGGWRGNSTTVVSSSSCTKPRRQAACTRLQVEDAGCTSARLDQL